MVQEFAMSAQNDLNEAEISWKVKNMMPDETSEEKGEVNDNAQHICSDVKLGHLCDLGIYTSFLLRPGVQRWYMHVTLRIHDSRDGKNT